VTKILNTLFQEAIRFGKQIRSQTGIDQHPVSVSYAAVELARSVFGDLSECTVLIIGQVRWGTALKVPYRTRCEDNSGFQPLL